MTLVPLDEVKRVLQRARDMLSDGLPRKGSEIAALLRQKGIDIDKKRVNQILFSYGKPDIVYDTTRFTYSISSGSSDFDTSAQGNRVEEEPEILIRAESDSDDLIASLKIRNNVFVRVPIDGASATSLADCRDFRIGKVIDVNEDGCTVAFVPGAHDYFTETQLVVASSFVKRCRIRSQTAFTHVPTGSIGLVLIACDANFNPVKVMSYYVLLEGVVTRVAEVDMSIEAHAQFPHPQDQIMEYEFHPSIWKSKRDQLLQSYNQMQSATFGIEELVGSRILLLPHQAETIARVLGNRQCRYVLADEVGLGKTIEACVVLKGLKRRNPELKTLIVVPNAIIKQWKSELDRKFWLDFSLASKSNRFEFDPLGPGILIGSEDLELYPRLVDSLLQRHWDLLIIDEAHKLQDHPDQYEMVLRLSSSIEHCLVLSATPILRYSREYLSLLRLQDPNYYRKMSVSEFESILATQSDLRRRLAYVGHTLNVHEFDCVEFHEEIDPLLTILTGDRILPQLLNLVQDNQRDNGLAAAREVHSYLSENYRIEKRVIRNRRASLAQQLSLPTRSLEDSYSYDPTLEEREALAEVTDYAVAFLSYRPGQIEIIRHLFSVAASSPNALQKAVAARISIISGVQIVSDIDAQMGGILELVPEFPNELQMLKRLQWRISAWIDETNSALDATQLGKVPSGDEPHRILQVLRAVYDVTVKNHKKLLIFCQWDETKSLLEEILTKHFGSRRLAVFSVNDNLDDLQDEVDRFQSDPDCQIMLSDETGGEGRNFQIADTIIHVDLPWLPAQVEQRIGRVDRIGRTGVVTSLVPYARGSAEADLFRLWHEAFQMFTKSISGMEIVLEAIQNEIIGAFEGNLREGLRNILPDMTVRADELRAHVEEERYAEENAAELYRREEFGRVLNEYQDGEQLRRPLLKWAELAGLPSDAEYDRASNTRLTIFEPEKFRLSSIKNAKFVNPPNMEEALRRSGRQRRLVIRGTFDREIAVQREDIVFFAPGESWTDALIVNALQSDRGQTAAIMRTVAELEEDWQGFDCLYSIYVDPRPLLDSGFDPVNLFHAQGYLNAPNHRVLIGLNGEFVNRSSVIWNQTADCQLRSGDVHLGKRSGHNAPLKLFMERFPKKTWAETVSSTLARAEQHVRTEYEFASELAEEAAMVFERKVHGQRAAHLWLHGETSSAEIDEYEQISRLLVAAIANPLIQLESVCFWWLRAAGEVPNGLA